MIQYHELIATYFTFQTDAFNDKLGKFKGSSCMGEAIVSAIVFGYKIVLLNQKVYKLYEFEIEKKQTDLFSNYKGKTATDKQTSQQEQPRLVGR